MAEAAIASELQKPKVTKVPNGSAGRARLGAVDNEEKELADTKDR